MRLSKRGEYGIKATVKLAQRAGNGYQQSREIAGVESLPPKFLESILLGLRSAGILESKVGAGGGYRLARPAEQIPVTEILDALETGTDEVEVGPANTLGQASLGILNERMSNALHQAIGDLSLADLVELSEKRLNSGETVMYYI